MIRSSSHAPLALALLALVAGGCAIPVAAESPPLAEAHRDFDDVEALSPEPEGPKPELWQSALDYLYQGTFKYWLSWIPTFLVNLPAVAATELMVHSLVPASLFGCLQYQDWVDDGMYYVYGNGVNFRKMWNVYPRYLGVEHDLVERDRRESEPADLTVSQMGYPNLPSLQPPPWDAPSRSGPGFQPGGGGQ